MRQCARRTDALGEPDLLVFTAGSFQKSNVLDIDPAEFERCWRNWRPARQRRPRQLTVPKLSTFICGRRSSRPLRPQHRSVLSIAVGGESLNASKPSISGEQPNNGTPSFRKARSSSTPRESANVKPCRSRHIRPETRVVVTTFRASSTHAPSSFPWKLIDKRVIGTGSVMSSNAWTPESLRLHRRW